MYTSILNPDIAQPGVYQKSALIIATDADFLSKKQIKRLPGHLANAPRRKKIQYLAGDFCMREALDAGQQELSGISESAECCHDPIDRSQVISSVSHTSTFVTAAVAKRDRYIGIGVNSQKIFNDTCRRKLWSFMLTKQEIANFHWISKSAFSKNAYVSLMFSGKEAIVKALTHTSNQLIRYQDIEIKPRLSTGQHFTFSLAPRVKHRETLPQNLAGSFDFRYGHVHTVLVIPKD